MEFLIDEAGIGFESQFDFIRDFVRYDKKQLPLFYYERNYAIILSNDDLTRKPILMESHEGWKDRLFKTSFFEFEILNHRFSVSLVKNYAVTDIPYDINKMSNVFSPPKQVTTNFDIDFSLSKFDK